MDGVTALNQCGVIMIFAQCLVNEGAEDIHRDIQKISMEWGYGEHLNLSSSSLSN